MAVLSVWLSRYSRRRWYFPCTSRRLLPRRYFISAPQKSASEPREFLGINFLCSRTRGLDLLCIHWHIFHHCCVRCQQSLSERIFRCYASPRHWLFRHRRACSGGDDFETLN